RPARAFNTMQESEKATGRMPPAGSPSRPYTNTKPGLASRSSRETRPRPTEREEDLMTILTVGNGGFEHIQDAVAAAVDGDTIEIAAGTYTEDVTITGKSLNTHRVETGGVNNVTLNGQITVAGLLNGAFAITDLNINAAGKAYGVFVSANSTGFAGSVTLDDVAISNAKSNGFAYIRAGNGSTPTNPDTIGPVSILNSEFSNNATATGGGGRGGTRLFGSNSDL